MDDPDFYDNDDGYCEACGGEGWILDCCDDICHGLGYCMHGDGMRMCHCNTSGEPPSNVPADWEPAEIEGFQDCDSPFHPGCSKCEVKK